MILFKLVIKNLKENKVRTLVTIIGTLLAVILMFGVGILASSIRENELRYTVATSGDYHAAFTNDLSVSDFSERLNKNKNIEKVIDVKTIATYQDDAVEYTLKSADFSYEDNFTLSDGRLPKDENEVIIPKHLLGNKEKMGDSINIGAIPRKVVGVYEISDFDHYDYDEGYYDTILYTKSSLNYPSISYVYYKDMSKSVELTYEISKDFGFKRRTLRSDQIDQYENERLNINYLMLFGVGSDEFSNRAHLWLSIALGVLALFSSLAIYNAFSISISERSKSFGILRSVGAKKSDLFKLVFLEALVIALITVPIGMVLSISTIYLAQTAIFNMIHDIGVDFGYVFAIYPEYIFFSFIFSLIMIFISALVPAIRASRQSPMAAIKMDKNFKVKNKKHKTSNLKLKLFGIEWVMASNNVSRDSKRYRSAKISIIISVVLFMIIGNFVNYFVYQIKNNIVLDKYPITLGIEPTKNTEKIIREILSYPEVDDYLINMSTFAEIPITEGVFTDDYVSKIRSHDDTRFVFVIALDEHNYSKLKKYYKTDKEVFVSKYHIDKSDSNYVEDRVIQKYRDVDQITLYANNNPEADTLDTSYTLDNIYFMDKDNLYDFGLTTNDSIFVSEDKYYDIQNHLYHSLGTSKAILLDSEKQYMELDKKLSALDDKYEELDYNNNGRKEVHQDVLICNVIVLAIYTFMGFIILIAVSNVVNTIYTNMNLRRREFANLKSIGLSNKGFNKLLLYEGCVLAFDSLIFGQLISNILIFLMAISNIFGDEVLPYPFMYLFLSIIGVFAIIIVSMYFATRKIRKANIIEVIRDENI